MEPIHMLSQVSSQIEITEARNYGGMQIMAANNRPIQFYVKNNAPGTKLFDTEEVMRINGDGKVELSGDFQATTAYENTSGLNAEFMQMRVSESA